MKQILTTLFIIVLSSVITVAQEYQVPKNEFRGAWMATVINLDWPQTGGLAPRFQQSELIDKLDKLKDAGINIVYFQIRTEGDALYDSPIEPWSKYLTGEEGKAPDPYWDPLEYAIEAAHKRGMELHAWLNPYRAMRTIPDDFTQKALHSTNSETQEIDESLKPFLEKDFEKGKRKQLGTTARDEKHVSNTHPEWLFVMNDNIAIMDPGHPEVIDYNVDIVMDVVNRYDVDGIHFDDYFYPYPPNHMASFENDTLDDNTFELYPRGFTDKDDWRRNNIDIFVEALHDSIQIVKPWVKFGISPFGIWKNGTPSGISGMDAYEVIYGDGIKWLQDQTVDYLTPQLYWEISRFGTGQDYKKLANWWADSASVHDRHLYPGHGLYRSDANTFSNPTLFAANEVPRQIRINRENPKIQGSVFFRTKNLTNYSSKGFKDSLKTNFYKYAALQPVMEWKSMTKPDAPENLIVNRDTELEYVFEISWSPSSVDQVTKVSMSGHVDTLIKYAVYRVDSGTDPDELSEMDHYYNLIEVTGDTTFTDIVPPSQNGYWYFVTAVSRNNVESDPTPSAEGGIVVSNDEDIYEVNKFSLSQNYPNPFNPSTEIKFNLEESGFTSLRVYDMLGRQVTTLVNENLTSGSHSINFDASNLASGIYIYRLVSGNNSTTRRMTLIK
jgi:uncharacterized lipoprotein YddW (UPF0748 family)